MDQIKYLIQEANIAPERVHEAVRNHFILLKRDAERNSTQNKRNGILTPRILQDIDSIYDYPGFPTIIAETLGVIVPDIQGALKRCVDIVCERCGKIFVVEERRRIGGYTKSKRTLCARCKKEKWAEARIEKEGLARNAAKDENIVFHDAWKNRTIKDLMNGLHDQVQQLENAIKVQDQNLILQKTIDVASHCVSIHDIVENHREVAIETHRSRRDR
ncbi:MAG: hypothetical protein JXB42_11160 [Deltaproteobacteria bacterium]|nr:hypothetical protein [Deltaproteobacteria bacterium]